nr:MAG TPA: Protein prenyltransferase alpha subunit repeat [Caudoviricetes sp.]
MRTRRIQSRSKKRPRQCWNHRRGLANLTDHTN